MDLQGGFTLLGEQLKETSLLQWVAVSFGVAEVLLARANKIWLYPAGIIGTALSIILLIDVKLYAEALLYLYYIVMSVYGWIYWVRRKDEPVVPVSYNTKAEWWVTTGIVVGGWLILYTVLKHFTDSDVPALDAWISSTAWAGMWLLARRKIENWVLLNISNLFAMPLLFYKDLPLFALLTLFLFVVAIFGYRDWKRIERSDRIKVNTV